MDRHYVHSPARRVDRVWRERKEYVSRGSCARLERRTHSGRGHWDVGDGWRGYATFDFARLFSADGRSSSHVMLLQHSIHRTPRTRLPRIMPRTDKQGGNECALIFHLF